MAYSDLDVEIVYEGDGVSTSFPINFARVDDSQVKAELYDVSDPDNPVQLTFDNPSDWQVVGNNVVASVAPTADQKVFVYRDTTPTHETEYTEYEFPYATVNIDIDKIYQLAQENKNTLGRAVLTDRFNAASGDGEQLSGASISQNTANIATNTANIVEHETRISTIEAQISTLVVPTIYSITSAETYVAKTADVVIIDTVDLVQIDLPTPTAGYFVRIKVSEKVGNKVVYSAAGIDGFGTNYVLTSEYESLSLVSDGTKWYII